MSKNNFGFTLVELLVVITIIGLLAAMSVISLSGIRQKARDIMRLADIRQLHTGLEVYKMENSLYPTESELNNGLEVDGREILGQMPHNPKPRNDGPCPDQDYVYTQLDGGKSYEIEYCLGGTIFSFEQGFNYATPEGLSVD